MESFPIDIIDDIMADVYKQKATYERLKIAFGLWNSTRKQLFHNLRSLRPDWDEEQVWQEVTKRMSHGAV